LKPLKIIEVYGCNGCPHFCGDSRQGYYCMKLNILAKVDGILNECPLTEWNTRPAPDKTGFEEWYQKYCDESVLIEDRIVDIRAAWNAALSQKEGERCPDMKNCNKGDVLSPYKPHEILAECTKYPKQCKGGAKQ